VVCKQDEKKQQHRESDPQPERPSGIPGATLVAHHEKQRRTQTRKDAQKEQTNDDFHRPEYRMHLRRLIPSLAALGVIVLTAALGQWQLRRADEKAEATHQRQAALNRAPVVLTASSPATALDGALVSVEGRWLTEKTIFLDNRTRKGVAGFHVVTPLQLHAADQAAELHVLVLRGWVAREVLDRTRLPQFKTPEGRVRIEGLGLTDLPQPIRLSRDSAFDPQAPRIWQHLDPRDFARESGLPLHGLMVRQLSEADDGLMRDWAAPGRGEDKHRAYAFQWFALSGVTALIWIGLSLRRRP